MQDLAQEQLGTRSSIGRFVAVREDLRAIQVYGELVRDQLGLFATWPPVAHVEVGSVGLLDGSVFRPGSDLSQYHIPFSQEPAEPIHSDVNIRSQGVSDKQVDATATASIPLAKVAASVRVSFDQARSVYLDMRECHDDAMKRPLQLSDRLLDSFVKREWLINLVVVTRVTSAAATTLLQSSNEDASVTVSGTVAGPSLLSMLKAGGAVEIASSNSIGLNFLMKGKLTPLVEVSGLKFKRARLDPFLGISPRFSIGMGEALVKIRKAKGKSQRVVALRELASRPIAGGGSRVSRHDSTSLESLESYVRETPNIELNRATAGPAHVDLDVKFARFGDHYDLGNLFFLNSKLYRIKLPDERRRIAYVDQRFLNRSQMLGTLARVKKKGIRVKSSKADFINLRVPLKKSARRVNLEGLNRLAEAVEGILEANARSRLREDLEFGVIPAKFPVEHRPEVR